MLTAEPVGHLLRGWRMRRNLSQLELANQTDISTRHISFVETGRTTPSSAMVLRLAEHLDVPLRERNKLLVAAGHAPIYRDRPTSDPDAARVQAALRRILDAHEPYPAVALDHRWNILLSNAAFAIFLHEVRAHLLRPPVNLMRLGLHPHGFAPRVRNLSQVRAHLLPRLDRQATRTGDPFLRELHEELRGYGPDELARAPDPADIALPIHIDHQGAPLCFITTITTFGSAFDVALEDVAIETYLPADDGTADYCFG